MKFLFPEAALSHTPMHVILLSCLIWWELLDKLQKRICRTVGPPEPFAHRQNIASLSLFYSYYFDEWSSELVELVPLPSLFFKEASCYTDRSHDFSVIISRCYKDVYVNSFCPRTATLRHYVPIECLPLTCDLNGFKSRSKRNLLTVGFF